VQDTVLEGFAGLPTGIQKPWLKDSRSEYDALLKTHGSHVVTAVTYSASIEQYVRL
jgi:hypothetical protein